jgi:hypothetical protein
MPMPHHNHLMLEVDWEILVGQRVQRMLDRNRLTLEVDWEHQQAQQTLHHNRSMVS